MPVKPQRGVTTQVEDRDAVPARLRAIVFSDELLSAWPLPDEGTVIIGRGEDAAIRVDARSLSRAHARLTAVSPGELMLEDLGSANGTRLKGRKLARGHAEALHAGDSFELGSVTVLIQRAAPEAPVRRLVSHSAFLARLGEACAAGRAVTVVRLSLAGRSSPREVLAAAGSALSPGDLLAAWAPGELEVLLGGAGTDVSKLKAALDGAGLDVRVGSASAPADGRTADALLERAAATLAKHDGAAAGVVPRLDAQMKAVYALVAKVAPSRLPVLIAGETGVGKEVLARELHRASGRTGPFVAVNCAAVSPALFETELFGHAAGAFTGAAKARKGLLESADGGTVLLDEVAELPLPQQAKLLRALEERSVTRVGETEPRPIDVRVLSATHRDVEAMVERGELRRDLAYRLNALTIVVPPLRERPAEIEPLAREFAARAARELKGAPPLRLSSDAVALLTRHDWPGNVRELKNVIERAVALCDGDELWPEHLPLDELLANARELDAPLLSPESERQRARVLAALDKAGGNQGLAAQALGISRRTLLNWLDALSIPRPRKGKPALRKR